MQLRDLAAGSLFLVLVPHGDVFAESSLHAVEIDHATGSETSPDLTSPSLWETRSHANTVCSKTDKH